MTDDLVMVVDLCFREIGSDPELWTYRAMIRSKDHGPISLNGFRVVKSYELGRLGYGSWKLVTNISDYCVRLDNGEITEEDLPDSLYN